MKRICNVLNELTVEEFLEIYSESIQDKMSELGYYVQDGLICIDQEERMYKEFEKIIEKLEEIREKKTCNKEKCDTKELCRICVVDDAIEIVKGGGVNVN